MELREGRPGKSEEGSLLAIYDEVARCNRCGFCLSVCPVYAITGEERAVARGHNVHLQDIIEGRLMISKELKQPLFDCLLCRACVENCMSGVITHHNVITGRAAYMRTLGQSRLLGFVFSKVLPDPKKMDFYVRAAALGKRTGLDRALSALGVLKWFGRDKDKVVDLIQHLPLRTFRQSPEDHPGDLEDADRTVAYFVGCGTNYALPYVASSTVRVLKAAGCSVRILDNVCCGLPPFSYGDLDAARELARRNIEVMAEMEVDAIVTDCGSCSSFLKEYPDLFMDDPLYKEKASTVRPKLKALSEYLGEIGIPELPGSLDARVTYHDPCHMSRYQNLVNEPREIISRIPGIEYQELPEAGWCCGAAGTYNISYYGQSMQVLDRKVENIKKTGADIVVTTCPACNIQLAHGLRRHGLGCEVLDLAELVDRVLMQTPS
ncbi:MAG: (Fe-S)-binding protein [Deltaproteobacteria bacterium]|nr:(Fe-S)-binding protein [Deltaproteobacteria bacterium]